ncbi:hypothetical protein EON63_07825 [archaeon]|nr:MAG: hypothetical protein EON63_07825 [archaeon]
MAVSPPAAKLLKALSYSTETHIPLVLLSTCLLTSYLLIVCKCTHTHTHTHTHKHTRTYTHTQTYT